MKTEFDPIIDNWYKRLDKGQMFMVVAFDEDTGLIDLQHFDGDIEELTLREWRYLNLELCEEPENWAGPYDFGNVDDLGTEITDTTNVDWAEPLEENI